MVKQANVDGDLRQIDSANNMEESEVTVLSSKSCSSYKYTEEDIEKFFDSDNGQEEEHTLEDSICRPLIGLQNYKPFFLYCKMCPEVENIHLLSIENHIRLKDPERHKAKLLEFHKSTSNNKIFTFYLILFRKKDRN